jgi:hypothetical protein
VKDELKNWINDFKTKNNRLPLENEKIEIKEKFFAFETVCFLLLFI